MGCSSCGSGGCSTGSCGTGCGSKNGSTSSGCNKLNVYDWLVGMQLPPGHKPFNIVEVRFKGGRKEFFRNNNQIELYMGDPVIVDADNGFDIGHVSLKGELVKLQLKKYNIADTDNRLKVIQRLPRENELVRYKEIKAEEPGMLQRARTVALQMGLQMKLSDIELQGDRKKVIFFYTAEDRVDFRELIKKYADEFRTRIEMRQIGYRQEASRLGGIGSCGRELCCSTWLTDFKLVTTGAARYQNLSMNPLKLQGQCGKLKCCLNYELDTYLEAWDNFPPNIEKLKLQTQQGVAFLQKTDILKQMMWFAYVREGVGSEWVALGVEEVKKVIELNKAGQNPETLGVKDKSNEPEIIKTLTEDMEGSLTRLDNKGKKGGGNNRRNNSRNNSGNNRNPNNNRGGGGNNNSNRGGGGNPGGNNNPSNN